MVISILNSGRFRTIQALQHMQQGLIEVFVLMVYPRTHARGLRKHVFQHHQATCKQFFFHHPARQTRNAQAHQSTAFNRFRAAEFQTVGVLPQHRQEHLVGNGPRARALLTQQPSSGL